MPLIGPGVGGIPATVRQLVLLLPHALAAFTQMLPETYPVANDTVTFVVPCPLVIVAPAGTVHVYELAEGTLPTE